ncbi:DUF3820 family protein [Beggiatoa alba]|nr:DUF3820 family protein [Beggiatoa alba]
MSLPQSTSIYSNVLPETKPLSTNKNRPQGETLQEGSCLLSDPQQLLKLAAYRMPFGKYASQLLIDLPEPYVVWFANKGFPKGELGVMLGILYEIKVNGLEYLFKPLRKKINHEGH